MSKKRMFVLGLLLSTSVAMAGNRVKVDEVGKEKYTYQTVWEAYDGFNKTFLDSDKYIYKTNTSFSRAIDRGNGAAAIWCQPIYCDIAMNAYRLSKERKYK